ncbi:MAG: hypothetical protein Q7S60_00320 [bacterium]|nr:hypothetical protein [bacterium]
MSALSPTADEIKQTALVLKKLKPGHLPFPIFKEVTRLVTTPIVEVVPLHVGEDGTLQVLLTQRNADDPFWANQFHVPGTVVLATDQKGVFDDAFKRIFSGELGNITVTREPVKFTEAHRETARGSEVAFLYWALVEGKPPERGKYFDVEDLPTELVPFAADAIKDAVKAFKAHSSNPDSNPSGVTTGR